MQMDTTLKNVGTDPVLLVARRTCYRFLALALADPRYGTFRQLAHAETRQLVSEAAEIIRGEDAAVGRPLGCGERPLADLDPTTIFTRLPDSAAALNATYEETFGLLGGSKCPPYETEYVSSKFTFQRSNILADVAGFYRAFGFQTSSSNPDRPDHIALQCEFLAQLLQLQLRCSSCTEGERPCADVDDGLVCQEALQRFLSEHFVWWAPAFAKLLSHQNAGGFYDAVARFLAAMVPAERALAGIASPQQVAELSQIENLDECSGCLVAIRE
jgi:TorA maturation chaperone TorD